MYPGGHGSDHRTLLERGDAGHAGHGLQEQLQAFRVEFRAHLVCHAGDVPARLRQTGDQGIVKLMIREAKWGG